MNCRPGCGACCIAPSITSYIPGMPDGKPAGVRCVQLAEDNRCKLFGKPERPAVCGGLQPSKELCRESAEDAMKYLEFLEEATIPSRFHASRTDGLYERQQASFDPEISEEL